MSDCFQHKLNPTIRPACPPAIKFYQLSIWLSLELSQCFESMYLAVSNIVAHTQTHPHTSKHTRKHIHSQPLTHANTSTHNHAHTQTHPNAHGRTIFNIKGSREENQTTCLALFLSLSKLNSRCVWVRVSACECVWVRVSACAWERVKMCLPVEVNERLCTVVPTSKEDESLGNFFLSEQGEVWERDLEEKVERERRRGERERPTKILHSSSPWKVVDPLRSLFFKMRRNNSQNFGFWGWLAFPSPCDQFLVYRSITFLAFQSDYLWIIINLNVAVLQ